MARYPPIPDSNLSALSGWPFWAENAVFGLGETVFAFLWHAAKISRH
ncbi:MAG: hypothetical protein JWM11_404 [Planctomycetaceae bacterium]|nr:hypothetical protein [Planctomycetaceae bacterium]